MVSREGNFGNRLSKLESKFRWRKPENQRYLVGHFVRAFEGVWKHHGLIGQTFKRPAATKGVDIKHVIVACKWELRLSGGAPFTTILDYNLTRPPALSRSRSRNGDSLTTRQKYSAQVSFHVIWKKHKFLRSTIPTCWSNSCCFLFSPSSRFSCSEQQI